MGASEGRAAGLPAARCPLRAARRLSAGGGGGEKRPEKKTEPGGREPVSACPRAGGGRAAVARLSR